MKIRALIKEDFDLWKSLFSGYCLFYKVEVTEKKSAAVWSWIIDVDNPFQGLVAENSNGDLIGLAHYYPWPDSLQGNNICYLSDLFVTPESRGKNVARQLFQQLMIECKQNNWASISLLTQENNKVARALYDQLGEKTDFVFYECPVKNHSPT